MKFIIVMILNLGHLQLVDTGHYVIRVRPATRPDHSPLTVLNALY